MYENENNRNNYSTYEYTDSEGYRYGYNPVVKEEKKEEKKSKGGIFKKILLCICLGILFGVFAGASFYTINYGIPRLTSLKPGEITGEVLGNGQKSSVTTQVVAPVISQGSVTFVDTDITRVVEEVMPSMVTIVNTRTVTGSIWGIPYSEKQTGGGTGIVVASGDEEYLIVTNAHVVEGAEELIISFVNGKDAHGVVKGADSSMDLAVVAIKTSDIDDETKEAIKIAKLGDSTALKLGEPVYAIGNAMGYGQSVTNGIVSALDRKIETAENEYRTFIQTNAAINPGNSGGGLFNVNGEVVGINSSKIVVDSVEGMCFAIPISAATPIIQELMEKTTRFKVDSDKVGFLGITYQEINSMYSSLYGMPMGVYVYDFTENSAAEKAGILKKDIIVKLDDFKVNSAADMQNALLYFAVGDSVEITIMRLENGNYAEHVYRVILGRKTEE